jgi:hypothetical protein
MIAALVQKLSEDGRLPPGFDPEAPFMEWIQEAVELSTAPQDASLFQAPADYRRVPVEELLESMMRPPAVSP